MQSRHKSLLQQTRQEGKTEAHTRVLTELVVKQAQVIEVSPKNAREKGGERERDGRDHRANTTL